MLQFLFGCFGFGFSCLSSEGYGNFHHLSTVQGLNATSPALLCHALTFGAFCQEWPSDLAALSPTSSPLQLH
jgi:hypothetical protein